MGGKQKGKRREASLCYAIVRPARRLDFGDGFQPDCCGRAPKAALRPAFGRPEGRFRCFPESSPAEIRPGRPIYGPEALLRNIGYQLVWGAEPGQGTQVKARRRGVGCQQSKRVPEGSLAGNLWAGFRPIFGQTWPQNTSRSTGLVLQCWLHQKSARQINSKAISWRQKIPARLPSGTQSKRVLGAGQKRRSSKPANT